MSTLSIRNGYPPNHAASLGEQPFKLANTVMPGGNNCDQDRSLFFEVIGDFANTIQQSRQMGLGQPIIGERSIRRFTVAANNYRGCNAPDEIDWEGTSKHIINQAVLAHLDRGKSPEDAVGQLLEDAENAQENAVEQPPHQNTSNSQITNDAERVLGGFLLWFWNRLPRPGFSY
jgi:hypothetical protein